MSEQTQEQITTVLSELITTVTQAKDFALAQLPDIIHQLLVWNFIISLSAFLICLLIILGAVWFNIWQIKNWDRLYGVSKKNGIGAWRGGEPLNTFQVFLVIPFALLFNSTDWLQIWIAPKLWLIEYAANLIN